MSFSSKRFTIFIINSFWPLAMGGLHCYLISKCALRLALSLWLTWIMVIEWSVRSLTILLPKLELHLVLTDSGSSFSTLSLGCRYLWGINSLHLGLKIFARSSLSNKWCILWKWFFFPNLKVLSYCLLALIPFNKPIVIHIVVLFLWFAFWIFPLSLGFCIFIITWRNTDSFHLFSPLLNCASLVWGLRTLRFSETLSLHLQFTRDVLACSSYSRPWTPVRCVSAFWFHPLCLLTSLPCDRCSHSPSRVTPSFSQI